LVFFPSFIKLENVRPSEGMTVRNWIITHAGQQQQDMQGQQRKIRSSRIDFDAQQQQQQQQRHQ
jgi:hypothetical protein